MFIGFNSNSEPIEPVVIRSCAWCSAEMPMDWGMSELMNDDELCCNACVEHADPFADSGIAIAWPGCSEYVYLAQQAARLAYNTMGTADYDVCLMMAALETVSEHAYGHTANQRLNGMVSSAAPKWEHNITECIALSTN